MILLFIYRKYVINWMYFLYLLKLYKGCDFFFFIDNRVNWNKNYFIKNNMMLIFIFLRFYYCNKKFNIVIKGVLEI